MSTPDIDKKRRGFEHARIQIENADRATALGDEEPSRIARRVRDEHWVRQTRGNALQDQ